MKIAVLLTVHNRKSKTLNCLEALYSQSGTNLPEIDVYLTDDGCTDGTPEAISNLFPDVKIVGGDGNLYWNRGMIKAWKRAASSFDYDAYLWLNDDTVLFPSALSTLYISALDNTDSIIVGAIAFPAMGEEVLSASYGGRDSEGRLISPDGRYQKCHTFNGNVVWIPQKVFKKLGMLDPVYSHAIGDFDYGLSANRMEIPMFLTPEFVGSCDKNSNLPIWLNTDYSFFIRAKALFSPLSYNVPSEVFHFKRKNYGLIRACLSTVSIFINLLSPSLWKRFHH